MEELFDLTGKVAVVTGSTKGIGRSIAAYMAHYGASVVVSSRKDEACIEVTRQLNDELSDGPGSAVSIPCNIMHKEQLQHLVDETRKRFGKIDILVCNAAVNPFFGSMADIPDSAFERIMDSNIRSNHWLCQMVIPEMVERKEGVITIISSIGGLQGSPCIGAYCISKAADMQLARNIAVEYGAHNIRANTIAPGLIKTHFSKALWANDEILGNSVSEAALKRIGEPHEIAGVAVMLAARAGRFITGQTLLVDGGTLV